MQSKLARRIRAPRQALGQLVMDNDVDETEHRLDAYHPPDRLRKLDGHLVRPRLVRGKLQALVEEFPETPMVKLQFEGKAAVIALGVHHPERTGAETPRHRDTPSKERDRVSGAGEYERAAFDIQGQRHGQTGAQVLFQTGRNHGIA